jgi:hypothetical protein
MIQTLGRSRKYAHSHHGGIFCCAEGKSENVLLVELYNNKCTKMLEWSVCVCVGGGDDFQFRLWDGVQFRTLFDC